MSSCTIGSFRYNVSVAGNTVNVDRTGLLGGFVHLDINTDTTETNIESGILYGAWPLGGARRVVDPSTGEQKSTTWGLQSLIHTSVEREDWSKCAKALGNTPEGEAVGRVVNALTPPAPRKR
jgi:hypothetical protein